MSSDLPVPIFDNLDFLPDPFRNGPELIAPELSKSKQNDYYFGLRYIISYRGSTATFNSYRREIERLLQWLWHKTDLNLDSIRREHIEQYLDFVMRPPKNWIGSKNVSRFKSKQGIRSPNPDWRPFVVPYNKALKLKTAEDSYAPSQKAIQSLFAILNSFFNFLIQEEFISANPIALVRQKSRFIQKSQSSEPVRRISNYQWDEVMRVAESLAEKQPEQHERTLFILNCLLGMYLRISELVHDERSSPTMGDFRTDQDRNWWLHVVGKGNKSRMITVSNGMMSALKRYRKFLGLPDLPFPGENTPLIQKIHGSGPVPSTRQIRSLGQFFFDQAYESLASKGQSSEASELKAATVHWLRHTGISEDVKIRPREHVKEDAGHSSMATTDKYIDSELRERHASAINKTIIRQAEDS
jgi:site-specific recombinase XerD